MKRRSIRSFLACFAMYVVALQAILTGFANLPAAAAFDPVAVICHSTTSVDAASADTQSPAVKHSCCDSCVLCHATPQAGPTAESYLVEFATPSEIIWETPNYRLDPHFIASRLPARGPPSIV